MIDDQSKRVCPEPDCALPIGHDGFHVPLAVLWQEAGYASGPWSKPPKPRTCGRDICPPHNDCRICP